MHRLTAVKKKPPRREQTPELLGREDTGWGASRQSYPRACCTAVTCSGGGSKALGREPVVNFFPSLIFRQAITFLELAFELLTAAIDSR